MGNLPRVAVQGSFILSALSVAHTVFVRAG
jgi:hypothetical protein